MYKYLFLTLCLFNQGLQASEISYQGKLKFNGELVSGLYDFDFEIFTDKYKGDSLEFISLNQLKVIDGVFTANLTLDPKIKLKDGLWLQVSIKLATDTTDYHLLYPRQTINSKPSIKDNKSITEFIDLSNNTIKIISLEGVIDKSVTEIIAINNKQDNDNLFNEPNALKSFDISLKSLLNRTEYEKASHLHDSLREIINADLHSETPENLGKFKQANGNKLSDFYTINDNKILIDITTSANPENVLSALHNISGIKIITHASTPSFSIITILSLIHI